MTANLYAVAALLQIKLIDHMIFDRNGNFFSVAHEMENFFSAVEMVVSVALSDPIEAAKIFRDCENAKKGTQQ